VPFASRQSPLLAKPAALIVPFSFLSGAKAQVPLKEPKPQYW
jgi:hypothetical protein